MKILVINCGSSSVKYRLFEVKKRFAYTVLAKGLIEKIGQKMQLFSHYPQGKPHIENKKVEAPDHRKAIRLIISYLADKAQYRVLASHKEIDAVGHRIVHAGETYTQSCLINEKVKRVIKEYSKFAPLHNPVNLQGIIACQKELKGIKQVAVFDTAFGQTMQPHAYIYAIPYKYYKKDNIRRYGFHGTSHRYVSMKANEILKKTKKSPRIITCHLGNGCSISAVKNGKCIDTSMGLTPLEGLMMGTRSGDLDPAILLYLMQEKKITAHQMDDILNKKSGLLGVSGFSNDMRDIIEAVKKNNKQAKLAFDIFIYRIKKYIGAYIAALGGIDAIVFTGGIGENVSLVRKRITKGINDYLASKVKILVIPTDEEYMIAHDTYKLIKKK
jgi:acetate kinase